MAEQIKKEVEHLKGFSEFKDYKSKCPNSYLCATFMILDSPEKNSWQLDYYCPDNDKITTFVIGDTLDIKEAKALHRDDGKIAELNLENVDIGLNKALEAISNLTKKSYPNEKAEKIVVILQNINKKETWNITYITSSFKVLNVNLDAQSGKILKEKLESILNFNTN